MTEHVLEWLGAYLDGELRGTRLHEVKAHLETCPACRSELQQLQELSRLLHEDTSTEGFTSADRFAANLSLQLPRLPDVQRHRKSSPTAWWFLPAGITATWVFVQTLLLVNNAVSLFSRFDLVKDLLSRLPESVDHTLIFTATMSLSGSWLGENGQGLLTAFDQTLLSGISFLSPILWQAGIVLLYWAVMLAWYMRRDRLQVSLSKVVKI